MFNVCNVVVGVCGQENLYFDLLLTGYFFVV